MPEEPVFVLRNVTKKFGDLSALTDINLQIAPHEQVALIGPSGAGKTTLLSLLGGTLHPTEGEVLVLGQNLTLLRGEARRQVQRKVGTIYQQLHLVSNLRVIHNINAGHLGRWSFIKALVSLFWPLEVGAAERALEQVGIPDKIYEMTGHLSMGQQQRVALARVLVQDPKAILADEPIASLDPERAREIMDLLRDLCREIGKTLVTSIHSVDFAKSHFNRVIGLRDGRILFDCPAGDMTPQRMDALYRIDRPGDSARTEDGRNERRNA